MRPSSHTTSEMHEAIEAITMGASNVFCGRHTSERTTSVKTTSAQRGIFSRGRPAGVTVISLLMRSPRLDREDQIKRGASAELALDGDGPTVRVDDVFDDLRAEPGAARFGADHSQREE